MIYKNLIKIIYEQKLFLYNKRFLFLYFILPIFFSTLKISTNAPLFKNNNLQIGATNQLQSLIKLMLISHSTINLFKKHNINSSINQPKINTSINLIQSNNQLHNFIKYNIRNIIVIKESY